MEHDHHNPLPLLLSTLRDKQPGAPVSTVVNGKTINLMLRLLSTDDYASFVEQLQEASDAENLIDFILSLLRHRHLQNPDTGMETNRRARHLMTKVFIKMRGKPPSLVLNATEVNMPPDRWQAPYVGGGSFGNVFEGKYRGQAVAVKELRKYDASPELELLFYREALMWRSLKHKFILDLFGIHELGTGTVSRLFLVSPYMKNGTLIQWRQRDKEPSKTEIQSRILEVAQGMEYIHSEGAVHGDICGSNVLLDDNLYVKIADFGLTRVSNATGTGSNNFFRNFAAPELFNLFGDESDDVIPRTKESDVYAFGGLYYEIHYGKMPFAGKKEPQIWRHAHDGILPPRLYDPPISDDSWAVIQSCWAREASTRPTMKEVKERVMAIHQSLSPVNLQSSSAAEDPTPPVWVGGAGLPPLHDSFAIHPFLDYEKPRSGYSFNLSSPSFCPKQLIDGRSFDLNEDTLSQLATYTPQDPLRIICDAIPDWSIIIESDPDSSPNTRPLTLGDVLYQIHSALHKQITNVEWERMDSGKTSEAVRNAYFMRCKSEGPTQEERLKDGGAKKVDYLLDKVWFKGLIRTGEGPNVLKLVVNCN